MDNKVDIGMVKKEFDAHLIKWRSCGSNAPITLFAVQTIPILFSEIDQLTFANNSLARKLDEAMSLIKDLTDEMEIMLAEDILKKANGGNRILIKEMQEMYNENEALTKKIEDYRNVVLDEGMQCDYCANRESDGHGGCKNHLDDNHPCFVLE